MHTTTHGIAIFGLVGLMGCADLSDDRGTIESAVTSGDFSLSANPTAQTVHRGGTAIYQIHVEALNGFTDTVTLTFTGRPNHDSGLFTDTSGNLVSPATRNHQGLDNRLITAVATPANENVDPAAPIARRERLGGLLSYYYRPAA